MNSKLRVLLFGATGMVGQGVLRECLRDPGIELVQTVGRTATGTTHPKLRELVRKDMFDYADAEESLTAFDACFFCLGVSAAGMSETDYTHRTYDLTLAAAQTLARCNPAMTFVYVSGTGTDSTERGRSMWARVKGRTENALLRLPFKAAFMFRPGFIEAMHGEGSKTAAYRIAYAITKPLLPVLRWASPGYVTTTEEVGRAMIAVAKNGAPKKILETRDIRALGASEPKGTP